MNTLIRNIATLTIQTVITIVVLACLYMIFAILDYNGGFDNIMGIVLFQPLMAFAFSVMTITGCFIVGLPIRLYRPLKTWWLNNQQIPVIGFIIGFVMLIISFLPALKDSVSFYEGDVLMSKEVPDLNLVGYGWFIIAFCCMHFYPLRLLNYLRPR